jgi:hypothetical protein
MTALKSNYFLSFYQTTMISFDDAKGANLGDLKGDSLVKWRVRSQATISCFKNE